MSNNEDEPATAAPMRVYRAILSGLDDGEFVPGQRLAESDLAAQHQVGRNAVREALQRLAIRGVVELSPHRSAAIRKLRLVDALDVLAVARVLLKLIAETAATRFSVPVHAERLRGLVVELEQAGASDHPGEFEQVRRAFYRSLLEIGANAELVRLFPSVSMHIVHAQFRLARLREVRVADYLAICEAVLAGDAAAAGRAAERHVDRIRTMVESMS